MDPKEIKLTTLQKIKPLFAAINKEIPWQIVLVFGIAGYLAITLPGSAAIVIKATGFEYYAIRTFATIITFITSVMGIAIILLIGESIFKVFTKDVPEFVKRIQNNYKGEALKVQKKVLDNVIDEEVLK